MKKILLSAIFLCALGCSGNDKITGEEYVNPGKPEEEDYSGYPTSYEFNHPCALVSSADINRVKERIAAESPSDPVYSAFCHFCENVYAQYPYKANPQEIIVRGDPKGTGVSGENYITVSRDAAAAFQLALRWHLTGEEKYARNAAEILDAWAAKLKKVTANDNNQYLCLGFQGYTLANAAELLGKYPGWSSASQQKFKSWLRTVWLERNRWFIENHGGSNNCPLHYWSNWELCNLASMLAIGIYLEDIETINFVYKNFREGQGSGCISNMIPYNPVADPDGHGKLAQNMESGRDQGHATLVISLCAELCQMAWNIGLDFWGMDDNKVLAMCEYTAKYNVRPSGNYLTGAMPFTEYAYCSGCSCSNQNHGSIHQSVSPSGRGKERPCWDLIYSHYKYEKKLTDDEVYYVCLFARQLRYVDGVLKGDGGSGDPRYGSSSGAFDQIGWGTMMFCKGE